jgi:ppGpp synthetase/RelA/SpoT-type nucleotidyltranferase
MFLSLHTQQIKKVISKGAIVRFQLGSNRAREIKKYSPEQPRDYHGRFGSGGSAALKEPPGRFGSGSVIFEFAPNPDNKEASDRWNALSNQEKADRSQKLADEYIPKILADAGIKGGEVKSQIGSYENDTNKSFTLVMPEDSDPTSVVEATKALGYNLSQKSMMTVSDDPFPNSESVDAINIECSKEFSLLQAKSLYDGLRTITTADGAPAIGGQTTNGKTMSILNFGGAMDTDTLRGKVDAYLKTFPGEYETHTSQVHSWFATEGDYGTYKVSGSSGREGGQQEGRVGEPVQQASGDYRSEIASIVSKAFQWALEAIKKAVLKGGPGSGRYPAGSGGEHVSEDQKNLIGPAKASKEQARTVLSKTGPYSALANQDWYQNMPGKDMTLEQAQQVTDMANHELQNEVGPKLQAFNQFLAQNGVEADLKVREKRPDSMQEKMNGRYADKTPSDLTDAVATRLIFESPEDMGKAVSLVKPGLGLECVEHDKFIENPKPGGYRGQHLLFRSPNGVVFELQMRTRDQNTVADYTHDVYKLENKFKGISSTQAQEAREYCDKIGDWVHARETGQRPDPPKAPGWMEQNGQTSLAFPHDKIT